LPVSKPVDSVDAVTVPDGMAARPISVPFKYDAPSSYMSSPRNAVTSPGSSMTNVRRKYVVMYLLDALGP
jgi:hypothetical protein